MNIAWSPQFTYIVEFWEELRDILISQQTFLQPKEGAGEVIKNDQVKRLEKAISHLWSEYEDMFKIWSPKEPSKELGQLST